MTSLRTRSGAPQGTDGREGSSGDEVVGVAGRRGPGTDPACDSCVRVLCTRTGTVNNEKSRPTTMVGRAGRFDLERNCDRRCAATHAGSRPGESGPPGTRRAEAPG